MIEIKIEWHLLLMILIQTMIVCRYIYICKNDKCGIQTFLASIFYGLITVSGWLIYGGIVWW